MKRRFLILLTLVILFLKAEVTGQELSSELLFKDFYAVLTEMKYSGTVVVSEKGEPVFHHSQGLANREQELPNSSNIKYAYASMGKMFTGVAIYQLVEQNKLKLSDRLIDVLPQYPNTEVAKRITIDQLLTHTSGITGLYNMQSEEYLSELKDYLPLFADQELQFEPGSRWSYSNAGYIVLGLIIEEVSDMKYADFLEQNIFLPAGMLETGLDINNARVEKRAINYSNWMQGGSGELRPVTYTHDGNSGGGGYSTPLDFIRFSNALTGFKLLSKESLQHLLLGRADARSRGRYAHGFYVNKIFDLEIAGHGGGGGGANGELIFMLNGDYSIAVLTNEDPHNATAIKDAFIGLYLKHTGLLPATKMSGEHTFELYGFEEAKVVTLQGAFTNGNQFRYPLKREEGRWITKIDLQKGEHNYRFVVDGVSHADPKNSDTTRLPGNMYVSKITIK